MSAHRLIIYLLTAVTALINTGCDRSRLPVSALFESESYTVFPDSIVAGRHSVKALSGYELRSDFNAADSMVTLKIPRSTRSTLTYESASKVVDAVHNMSVADLDSINFERCSTARLAYIVELALCYIDPERSKEVLLGRIESDGRIRQGRSPGGGWPVATDAIAWASAAWRIYETTGDRDFLTKAFAAVRNTLDLYEKLARDPQSGLTTGLISDPGYASALPYPGWMTPADAAASASLSASALTARAYSVAAKMALELGRDPKPFENAASAMREAINTTLWLPNVSYYSQYAYCQPFPITATAADNFAQGLAMAYDIPTSEMRDAILRHTPVDPLGIPAIYPQLPDTLVNPSNALVPAVQAYWAIGASKAGNTSMVYFALYALIRSAAMNLGNYPCVDIIDATVPHRLRHDVHDPLSAAANLGAIYRGMLGLTFTTYGIEVRPRVSASSPGEKHVDGFRYRDALLSIRLRGTGSAISQLMIDSVAQSSHVIPANLQGPHTIDIVLAGNMDRVNQYNICPNAAMPLTPEAYTDSKGLCRIMRFVPGDAYEVTLNAVVMQQIFTDRYSMTPVDSLTALCFIPVQEETYVGFCSKPLLFNGPDSQITVPADSLAYPGTSLIADRHVAMQFAETTESKRSRMNFVVEAPAQGRYWLVAEYANAHSQPWLRSDFCALRLVSVNGKVAPTPLVMPPTSLRDWTVTARSNMVPVDLQQGRNRLSILYDRRLTLNSHRTVNTALIKSVTLVRQSPLPAKRR